MFLGDDENLSLMVGEQAFRIVRVRMIETGAMFENRFIYLYLALPAITGIAHHNNLDGDEFLCFSRRALHAWPTVIQSLCGGSPHNFRDGLRHTSQIIIHACASRPDRGRQPQAHHPY
ncbi:hypothetical protein NBH20_01285 [Rhizobium sp. S153]|uniref:Uncharacterized protein n=1 Tax=Ciceribacter sichuanensis TaxID=2949647 RepID=A0ABT0V5A0_9HYPH|nr:hypothetical protein [Ciceribacter sp. S153]MCM2399775.1 hypothetical protein [Ciceribacter sp. S153]